MKSHSRTFSFMVITLAFLTGYGFFVFAAPPGSGGYNPGETLDPECNPGDLVPEPCIVKSTTSGSGWSLTGDAGTTVGTNFIGTTDAEDFMIKTDGSQIALFGQDGSVAIGGYDQDSNSQYAGAVQATGLGAVAFGGALDFSSGGNPLIASGLLSVALGNQNQASGQIATAFGNATIASGDASTSFGSNTEATGKFSTAFGSNTYARSYGETVFGLGSTDYTPLDELDLNNFDRLFTVGNDQLIIGGHNAYTLWKDGSFAYNDDNFQNDDPGTEQNMFYFNYGNHDGLGVAQTKRAIRLGSATNDEWDINNVKVGDHSVAIGFGAAVASGNYSVSLGVESEATGIGSVAWGEKSLASGGISTAWGDSRATGDVSTAFGNTSEASGDVSTAFGAAAIAYSYAETAIGIGNTLYVPNSTSAFDSADRLFVIGNHDGIFESDALTILKSGLTGIGYDNFETTTLDSLLQVNGSILSADLTGCDSLSSDADGKIICSGVTNGLEMISGSIGLGGTLVQNTTVAQGAYNFTVLQPVSTTGALVMTQGLTTVTGLPGNVMGYIAANADSARTISWASGASNEIIHTLSGSGDPDLLFGGAEIRTDYDITDTSSAMASLYAFDTPGGMVSRLQVTPTYLNIILDAAGELRLNSDPGTAGYVLASNGAGAAPTWEDPNLLVSDERLKSNVTDLSNDTLSKLSQVRTVTYSLNTDQTGRTQVGFLAQDLEQYFPELVGQKDSTYKGVYYAQMTPVLVQAIRELNLQMTAIDDMAAANQLRDSFTVWLADQANGIVDLYAEIVHSKKVETEQLCIEDICMDRDQLYNMMQSSSTPIIINPPTTTPDTDPEPGPDVTPDPETEPGTEPEPSPDGSDAPSGDAGTGDSGTGSSDPVPAV